VVARDKADTARINEQIRSLEAIRDEMAASGSDTTAIKKQIKNLRDALD